LECINVQATDRLGAGSVYFVRLGNGLPGRLGASWWGVSAIVISLLFKCCEKRSVGRARTRDKLRVVHFKLGS